MNVVKYFTATTCIKGDSMAKWLGCGHCSSPTLTTKLSGVVSW